MRCEKVSRCRCAGTGITPSASCCSRKRCGGERCKEYDGLADAIITNAIVMPAVELK